MKTTRTGLAGMGVGLGLALAAGTCAHATPVISAHAVNGGPIGFALADLGSGGGDGLVSTATVHAGGMTISFTGGSPAAGVWHGSAPNQSRSPFLGTGLTEANYLTAEPGGDVIITFDRPQTSLRLLWGSIDTYNALFLQVDCGLLITGGEIGTALAGAAFGSTGAAVTISGLEPFRTVVAHSDTPAFEFVPGLIPSDPVSVPEPFTAPLMMAAIMVVGFARTALGAERARDTRDTLPRNSNDT